MRWKDATLALTRGEEDIKELIVADFEGDWSVEAFGRALKETKCNVTRLELSNISSSGLIYLKNALTETKAPIEFLDLSACQIKDDGVETLCDALLRCRVKRLNLAGNFLTDAGVRMLARKLILTGHESLRSLDLSENDFGDNGAKSLAESIRSDACRLAYLDIGHMDELGPLGTKAILASLLSRKTPTSLRVIRGLDITHQIGTECGIPPNVVEAFVEMKEERSMELLLRWAADVVHQSQAVFPIIRSVLKVGRLDTIIGDYLYWHHPFSDRLLASELRNAKAHSTMKVSEKETMPSWPL